MGTKVKSAEKKYTFDVGKVKLQDLEGNDATESFLKAFKKPLHKDLGNGLFVSNPDFDMMPKAKLIHSNKPVVFTESEAESFKDFVIKKAPYAAFIKSLIMDHFKEV